MGDHLWFASFQYGLVCFSPDDEDATSENNAKVAVDVAPHESASQISSQVSPASSLIWVEADKAALEAKFSALMEKHTLEDEEEVLKRQREQIRKRKEALDLRAEFQAASAKISVFSKSMEIQMKTSDDGTTLRRQELEPLQHHLPHPLFCTPL